MHLLCALFSPISFQWNDGLAGHGCCFATIAMVYIYFTLCSFIVRFVRLFIWWMIHDLFMSCAWKCNAHILEAPPTKIRREKNVCRLVCKQRALTHTREWRNVYRLNRCNWYWAHQFTQMNWLTPSIDEEFTKVSRERLHCQRDTLKSLVCIFKLGFDQFQILRNNMIGAIEIEIFRQFCVCSG